jgi:hypothetical protein
MSRIGCPGADVVDANFDNAGVSSRRLVGLSGRDGVCNFDRVKSIDRAFHDRYPTLFICISNDPYRGKRFRSRTEFG